MKRFKKWLCGLLAVTLLVVCFVPVSADDGSEADDSGPVLMGDETGYFPYYDEFSDVPMASKPYEPALDLTQADLEGDAQLLSEAYMGQEQVIKLTNGRFTLKNIKLDRATRYIIKITYVGEESNNRNNSISLAINGEIPFNEAADILLGRVWQDEELDKDRFEKDTIGNEKIPDSYQIMEWSTFALQDFAIFTNDPLVFHFPAGENNELTIANATEEPLYIAKVELTYPEKVRSDAEWKAAYEKAGYKKVNGKMYRVEAEKPTYKSDQSIYPTYDRSNPATYPYDPYNIMRNTIGNGNWSDPGDWLTYTVKVEEAGLYYITLKYRQHQVIGSSTFRSIYVNGEIPSAAFQDVAFAYNVNWKNKTVSDKNGDAVPVYLKKGENEIKMQATVGKWDEVLRIVEASNQRLNDMYIQMVMITGTTPDKYFDYNLEKQIPDLLDTFRHERDVLKKMADEYDRLNGGKAAQSETLRGAVEQLDSMLDDVRSIPMRLSAFRDTISTLSTWIYDNMNQSLEMDYILVHSADVEIPKADASLWAKIKHFFVTFFLSFVNDYDMIGSSGGEGAITVWVTSGRDQASVLMDLITEKFTPNSGIQVNVSLVQTGFIEATLAGTGPDVAVGVSRGQPVNLACRGALIDLRKFDTYDEVVKRFSDNATVPYQFEGGTYAIPSTQSFFMMFYRKDVMEKLGMELPETWTDLLHMVPILQKNHMEVGLPYSVISAAAAVDLGMASKDIFPVLLLQNGGDVYNEDGTAATLDSEAGMAAFKQWCEYYQQYGFELVYDFYTRFRNGDMPIGIADLGMYNTLIAGAPELRDKWGMAPIPGTLMEDGKINRAVGSTGSGIVMFKTERTTGKNADAHQQKCWEFIDWFTSDEIQEEYNEKIENVMGPAGRNMTANKNAFKQLPFKEEEMDAIEAQREHVQDLREVPGSYFVSRCIDNAFRDVIYDGKNAREVFKREVQSINREIERKRKELGLA